MPKRIGIIGAGVCGIISLKCCLEQGLDAVVFEKTNYTGGLWRYQDNVYQNGIASVMKSTVINTSKELSAFSDFPPASEYPNFMHNSLMVDYIDKYCESFNFKQYVHFRHEIVSVDMNNDYEYTGRWKVCFRKLDGVDPMEVFVEVFDGVMICIGHHNTRKEPHFTRQNIFKGKILHTHSLKSSKGFEDQVVVVVGIGNSGVDAAVELSNVTKQVYLSTRRGSWIFRRVDHNGKPFDINYFRRTFGFLFDYLPYWLICSYAEWNLNDWFDHEQYQVKPKHRCLSSHPTFSDALPAKIINGTVKVKSDIERFTEEGVFFKGESNETKCDAVVLATGYKVSIHFLSQDILPTVKNKVHLYKHMFIHHHKHAQTLALIGLVQTIGPLIPACEMQCRYFALLNNSKLKLPPKMTMQKEIDATMEKHNNRFYESERHTFEVDFMPYMSNLARTIGCSPPIWRYLFTDTKLFIKLIFGVFVSYQFRLVGQNSWSGARTAIMTVQDRVEAPFATNATHSKSKFSLSNASYYQISMFLTAFALFVTVFLSNII